MIVNQLNRQKMFIDSLLKQLIQIKHWKMLTRRQRVKLPISKNSGTREAKRFASTASVFTVCSANITISLKFAYGIPGIKTGCYNYDNLYSQWLCGIYFIDKFPFCLRNLIVQSRVAYPRYNPQNKFGPKLSRMQLTMPLIILSSK